MPVIPEPINPIIPEGFSQEQESVLDPLTETLVKQAARVMGYDDPDSSWTGMMSPLISIYKSAAERALATKAFKESAQKLGPKMSEAANYLAKQYPRVAAHMKINPEVVEHPTIKGAHAMAHIPTGKVTEPIKISFSQHGLDQPKKEIKDSMMHEATHAAQSLGNKDMSNLYYIADKLVGVDNNPLEKTAIARGMQSRLELEKPWPGWTPKGDTIPTVSPQEATEYFKNLGLSLDSSVGGPKPFVKLRKWGSDFKVPENYVDISTLENVPPNILETLKKMATPEEVYNRSISQPHTASRGLRNIAKGITPISTDPNLRKVSPGLASYPDELQKQLHQILLRRGMMEK